MKVTHLIKQNSFSLFNLFSKPSEEDPSFKDSNVLTMIEK